ncbi:hypothetical protein [Mycobacterium intracellulare]|nr:hypothetical protein [Mycobacterium intracellulare]
MISRLPGSKGADGWSINLRDASLVGNATIRFAMPKLLPDEPIPVVAYSESTQGPRLIASEGVREGERLLVTTNHFSNWFVDRWNDVRDAASKWLGSQIDGLASLGAGSQPACPGEQDIRNDGYTITSDSGKRVYWCAGKANGAPVLKVVNGRDYGVVAEHTPGLTVTHTDAKDLPTNAGELLRPPPSLPGNGVDLLTGGGGIDYAMKSSGPPEEGVMVTPNAGAYLLSALDFGIGTYAMVLDRIGATDAVGKLKTTLAGEQCLTSYSEMATTNLQHPGDVAGFFSKALGMALDCAGIALKDADLGPIIAGVVSPIVWVIDGVKAAVNGLIGATDSLDTSGYRITITRPGGGFDGAYMLHPISDTSGSCRAGHDVPFTVTHQGSQLTWDFSNGNMTGTLNPDGSFFIRGPTASNGDAVTTRGVFTTENGRTVIRGDEETKTHIEGNLRVWGCQATFEARKQ